MNKKFFANEVLKHLELVITEFGFNPKDEALCGALFESALEVLKRSIDTDTVLKAKRNLLKMENQRLTETYEKLKTTPVKTA